MLIRMRGCLEQEETSMAKRSKQRRSTRYRARTLLSDVFSGVRLEMFLLCTLCIISSKLATVSLKILISELRRWWKTVSHSAGLTKTVRELCKVNSISSLMASDRKRRYLEVAVDAGMSNCFIFNDLVTEL